MATEAQQLAFQQGISTPEAQVILSQQVQQPTQQVSVPTSATQSFTEQELIEIDARNYIARKASGKRATLYGNPRMQAVQRRIQELLIENPELQEQLNLGVERRKEALRTGFQSVEEKGAISRILIDRDLPEFEKQVTLKNPISSSVTRQSQVQQQSPAQAQEEKFTGALDRARTSADKVTGIITAPISAFESAITKAQGAEFFGLKSFGEIETRRERGATRSGTIISEPPKDFDISNEKIKKDFPFIAPEVIAKQEASKQQFNLEKKADKFSKELSKDIQKEIDSGKINIEEAEQKFQDLFSKAMKPLEESAQRKIENRYKKVAKETQVERGLTLAPVSFATGFFLGAAGAAIPSVGVGATVSFTISAATNLPKIKATIKERPIETALTSGAFLFGGALGGATIARYTTPKPRIPRKVKTSVDFQDVKAVKVRTLANGSKVYRVTAKAKTVVRGAKGKRIRTIDTQTVSEVLTSRTQTGAIKSFIDTYSTSKLKGGVKTYSLTGNKIKTKASGKLRIMRGKGKGSVYPSQKPNLFEAYGDFKFKEQGTFRGTVDLFFGRKGKLTKTRVPKEYGALQQGAIKSIGEKPRTISKGSVSIEGQSGIFRVSSVTNVFKEKTKVKGYYRNSAIDKITRIKAGQRKIPTSKGERVSSFGRAEVFEPKQIILNYGKGFKVVKEVPKKVPKSDSITSAFSKGKGVSKVRQVPKLKTVPSKVAAEVVARGATETAAASIAKSLFKQAPKAVTKNKLTPILFSPQSISGAAAIANRTVPRTKQGTKTLLKQPQFQRQTQVPVLTSSFFSGQSSAQAQQASLVSPKTSSIAGATPFVPSFQSSPVNIFSTELGEPPKTPIIKKNIPSGKRRGWNVFIKTRGRIVKASPRPLPRQKALSRGARIVDNTTSRRFYIRPTNTFVKKPKKQDNYFKNNRMKFRGFRQQRGRRFPLVNNYIERSKYAIDSRGERKGITALGIFTRRTRRR